MLAGRGARGVAGRQSQNVRRQLTPQDAGVVRDGGHAVVMAPKMGGAVHHVAVIRPGQQDTPLHFLDSAEELRTASRSHVPDPTGVILREHGPSLGETPDPIGDFRPVILIGPRSFRREWTFG